MTTRVIHSVLAGVAAAMITFAAFRLGGIDAQVLAIGSMLFVAVIVRAFGGGF